MCADAGKWPERGEGAGGKAEVLEDGPGSGGAKDDGDDAPGAPTARAMEDVGAKAPAGQQSVAADLSRSGRRISCAACG